MTFVLSYLIFPSTSGAQSGQAAKGETCELSERQGYEPVGGPNS